MGRPKGLVLSPETRAKISAANRARWAGPERETLLAHVRAIGRHEPSIAPEVRPLFEKLRVFYRSSARAREEMAKMRATP